MGKTIQIILAAILLGNFASCEQKTGGAPKPEITVGIKASPSTLDPRVARDSYAVNILTLVFPGLFTIGDNLEPTPDLVEKFEQPDARTYVFHLRPGVKFAGGRELTTEDVKATLESLKAPDINSRFAEFVDHIDKIEILDRLSLRMELKEPFAPFLVGLSFGILPASVAKKSSLSTSELYGAGPYKIVKWVPGAEVELSRNPDYSGPAPYFEKIKFRIIPEDITLLMSLEKGEVQLAGSITPDELPRLKSNPRLLVRERQGINYSYMGFNLRDPVLSKPLVRKALAYAINRDEIINCLLKGTVVKADTLLSPQNWAFEPDVEKYDHDIEKAKTLLDQAGYPDPDGAGPLPRFRLSYKTSQDVQRLWIAQAIGYQFGKIGIDVEVRSLEWGTVFADIQAGNFQLYTLTWTGVIEPDQYYTIFHSQSLPPKGSNRGRYSNPEIDRLVTEARIVPDRAERRKLYSRVQKIVAQDLPYISLWYSKDYVVSDKRLAGFTPGMGGDWIGLAGARWQE